LNIEKNLILIKNEDKTEEIINCSPITNGKRNITFKNNKTYTYSRYNIEWSRSCTEINPQTVIIYEKGIPISGITKIIKFEELGYIRLIFKTGYHKLYSKSELDIHKNSLEDSICKDCFTYLKELAGNIDFESDNDFISRQFETMTAISPNSVLAKYLNHKTIKKINHYGQMIFPFGFNISQKEATEKALNNQISIIEGPPGTGKTQTILNIIANAIMENKTVAVVSNNNSATLNVFEKLKKYNVDFIAAYLGNKQNRTDFFEGQNSKYPDMSSYKLDNEKLEKIKADLINSQKSLEEMLDKKNKLAILDMAKSNLITESGHFQKYNNEDKFELSNSLPRQSADKYQGREKKIMLLSTVSDKPDEFMDNANLLNVDISRAENKLIIVVSDNEELLNNPLTHTDFFIFRKIDKAPVLVVEVDGYAFHANNTKQLKRDRMKDGILEKYNIPILRVATNRSEEEEKLKNKLEIILNIGYVKE